MMIRHKKFRIWDKGSKTYLSGDFSISVETGKVRGKYGEDYYSEDLIPEQYIGIEDIKGKEIYEGDILKVPTSDSEKIGRFYVKTLLPECFKGIVMYCPKRCRYIIEFEKNESGSISCEIGWGHETFEVIGNVNENAGTFIFQENSPLTSHHSPLKK